MLAAGLVLVGSHGHAALFSDDEARRAILDLRARVEENRQALDSRLDAELRKLADTLRQQVEEGDAGTRRGILDVINQIEALRAELAKLRGANEELAREVAEIQRRQKDVLAALDSRLRALEPLKVSHEGREFLAQPTEKADFDAAMADLRQSQFDKAAQQFTRFLQRYPGSGYQLSVLYWQGNAYYASREYKPAMDAYRALIDADPTGARAPEAWLAIANCQLELKDTRAARKTLDDIVKLYPQSEAATAARDRLSRLK